MIVRMYIEPFFVMWMFEVHDDSGNKYYGMIDGGSIEQAIEGIFQVYKAGELTPGIPEK